MSPSAVRTKYTTSLTDLPGNEEWDGLADRVGAGPFVRPGWTHAWMRAFSDAELTAATVRDGDGKLVAMMPLERGPSTLRAPVNDQTPDFGPLAEDEGALTELLGALFSDPRASVELDSVDARSNSARLADAAARSGRLVLQRTVASSPYILLEGSFEQYESSLSKNRRKSIRRQRRRLEERGEVMFEVEDGSRDLPLLLEELFAVEGSGWKGAQGTAILSSEATRRFYTEVAEWAAERNSLRLAFLRLDGRVIACDYVIEDDGVWYSLKAGFDEELRSHGPGALLLRDEIAYCYERGIRRFDLLGKSDDFKVSWTDRAQDRVWMRALRRDPVGLSMWVNSATREAIRPWVRKLRHSVRNTRPITSKG